MSQQMVQDRNTPCQTEARVATQCVTEAAVFCTAVQQEQAVAALEKGDRSPVTIADFGSQALVCRRLRARFPDDPIVAEETSEPLWQPQQAALRDQILEILGRMVSDASPDAVRSWIDAGGDDPGQRFWTLDPIDGTKGFLRGEQYAIALALVVDGEVKIGALACPALPPHTVQDGDAPNAGVVFIAERGAGAWMQIHRDAALRGSAQPIHVSGPGEERNLRMVQSVVSAHGNADLQQAVAQAVGISAEPLQLDSQAKYGAVARGDAALYLRLPSPSTPDYRERIWDHAAGLLIVEEAGGRVTDMKGQRLDFTTGRRLERNTGIVASNGTLHDDVLDALEQMSPSRDGDTG